MNRAFARFAPAALLLTLSACATDGDYPSLARRAVEDPDFQSPGSQRITGSGAVAPSQAEPAPAPPPPSADLTTRLTQLVRQAQGAHQRFAARRGSAERLIAAGGGAAAGSESWSIASVALADLDSARSDTMIAMAELDELYAARSVAAAEAGNPADAAAVESAWQQVSAIVAEEDAVLARLRGRLRT